MIRTLKRELRGVAMAGLVAAGLMPCLAEAEDAPPPPAERILEIARRSYASQQYDLEGSLRQGFSTTSFRLAMREGLIRFAFENPAQALQLEFRDDRYLLWEIPGEGKGKLVDEARYAEAVRGTDISYEDLAMRFLFWPGAVLEGDAKMRGGTSWVVAVRNPDDFGPYRYVRLWIDQRSGGLAQIEGYDSERRLVRKMMVTKVQQIDAVWMLKEMRVERYDPASGKVAGRTYLALDDPEDGGPGSFKKR